MRVALLQIRLDPKSRAANMQRLNAAVDRAAGVDPAPDLLVLPGACDTGGAPAGRTFSDAGLEGIRANLAWKAREWGVFIAAGSHVRRAENLVPCALLFDADGDIVVQSIAPADSEDVEQVVPVEPWPSAVGRIAVLEPTVGTPLADCVADGGPGTLIAMPVSAALTGKRRRNADANIALLRADPDADRAAYWAVVSEASQPGLPQGDNEPLTFLRTPGGRILASAADRDETLMQVDVRIEPGRQER